MLQSENTLSSRCSEPANLVVGNVIGFSKPGNHVTDEGRLVALTTLRDRCHVRGIGFKDNAVKRNRGRLSIRSCQRLWKTALLERKDATDAEDKARKLQQLTGLLLIAGKAMEDATRQVAAILFEYGNQFVLGLAAVNHQG